MTKNQPSIFNVGMVFFLLFLSLFCMLSPKGSESVICYRNYNTAFNAFFFYATKLGEFYLLIPLGLYILFQKRNYFLYAVVAFITQFLLIHFIKRWIDAPRPFLFFQDKVHFELIEGVPALLNHSMPSGHTALGICIFYTIAYLWPKRWIQITACIVAISVGLSRIYLLCHFATDVLAGAALGWLCVYAATAIYESKQ